MKNQKDKLDAAIIKKHTQRCREQNLENDFNLMQSRARAVTVGTAFGGSIEVSLRKGDGSSVFAILQPVETVELIHQLAAATGCHIHLQPRKDFSSWRNWNHTDEELANFRGGHSLPGAGHPPHSNAISPFAEVGANLPPPEQQPGLQPALMAKETQDEQTVAIEKTL